METTLRQDFAPGAQGGPRRHKRTSVIWSGRLADGVGDRHCVILNLSAGGAKLRLGALTAAPVRMTLTSPHFAPRRGKVVWRRDDLVGVSFASPAPGAA